MSSKRRVLIALLFTFKYFVVHICLKEAKYNKTLPLTKTNYGGYSSGNVKWAHRRAQVYQWLVDFPNQWIAILARFDLIARNSEYPWLFTVLPQEPRWRLVSTHFRQMEQSYTKQIPRQQRTLAFRSLPVGRKIFSCRYCNQIVIINLTRSPKCLQIVNKVPIKWYF